MYSIIVFGAYDPCGEYMYSFKVNLKAHALSLEYKNCYGGYTTNGIHLLDETMRKFENICKKSACFFANPKLEKDVFSLDPYLFELKMFKTDDPDPLKLERGMTDMFNPPEFLVELVELVMKLASFDNKGFRYF